MLPKSLYRYALQSCDRRRESLVPMSKDRAEPLNSTDSHVHLEATTRLTARGWQPSSNTHVRWLPLLLRDLAAEHARFGGGIVDLRLSGFRWFLGRGMVPNSVDIVRTCLKDIESATGVKIRLWLTIKREYDLKRINSIVDFAVGVGAGTIFGIDYSWGFNVLEAAHKSQTLWRLLHQRSVEHPIKAIVPSARMAQDEGLAVAIHLNPIDSMASMTTIVHTMNPSRIGHGIYVGESPALTEAVAKQGIGIEICPTALLSLHNISRLDAIDLPTMQSKGANFLFGTDHPLDFRTDIHKEVRLGGALLAGATSFSSLAARWKEKL